LDRGMLGECFGFSSSILCSVLPLRVKDLPLTLPLDGDGFFLQRIR
jgi:hypothetical protein